MHRTTVVTGLCPAVCMIPGSVQQQRNVNSNSPYRSLDGRFGGEPGDDLPVVRRGLAQHVGARERQEDRIAVVELGEHPGNGELPGTLALVADGIGGFDAAAEASALAVESFIRAYRKRTGVESPRDSLVRALFSANDSVLARAEQKGTTGNFGTTLVAAVIDGPMLHWVSAGDSRAYLVRGGTVSQLTRDHIYSHDLSRSTAEGLISAEDASAHPERDMLTSYVGTVDLTSIDQNMRPYPLEEGDVIVLCSDGLHQRLSDEQLLAAVDEDPQRTADRLIEMSVTDLAENQDNISVIALQVSFAHIDQSRYETLQNPQELGRKLVVAALMLMMGALAATLFFWVSKKLQ